AAVRTTAVADRGRLLRIAISPKNSPAGSTASTRSDSATWRRISISPVTTMYMSSPGWPSSNSTVPAGKSRAKRSSASCTRPSSHGCVTKNVEECAAKPCGLAPILARQRDLVARQPERDRTDQHLDVPAVGAIAHAERDQRRESHRAHRTDAGPPVAIHGVD